MPPINNAPTTPYNSPMIKHRKEYNDYYADSFSDEKLLNEVNYADVSIKQEGQGISKPIDIPKNDAKTINTTNTTNQTCEKSSQNIKEECEKITHVWADIYFGD